MNFICQERNLNWEIESWILEIIIGIPYNCQDEESKIPAKFFICV